MRISLLIIIFAAAAGAQPGWWMTTPVRWLQTNLRQTDSATDPARLVEDAARFRANVLHVNMGGIVAQYPTRVPFHYPSPHLAPGKDFFGDVVRLAHARGIRVVGRFDFSKTPKAVYDAHPEWFFRQANGDPVVYNGLYSTCINSVWYSRHILEILAEALERYEVDGLFFNMFGNQDRDYSGKFVGHCHCDECKRKFREMYRRDLPEKPDSDYQRFMFVSSRRVAAAIGDLIHRKRPGAGYFNYIQEHTDGIMSESNTAVSRPLPLWPYTSSDNVNRARNSQPAKASVNLCMQFVDYPWRFATVPPDEITLRLWQNIAHGGALAFAVNGTLEQQDRQAVEAARPVFEWAAANEQYLSAQQSAARVLLLAGPPGLGRGFSQTSYRGLFRILSEAHIPFAVANNLDWMGRREFDAVIATDWVPPELEAWVKNGGRLLIAHPRPPEFNVAPVLKTHPDIDGYVRVRDPKLFPTLGPTSLLLLDGAFTETAPAPAALTLVPESMYGPPEFIHIDIRDTTTPAIVEARPGRGHVTWLPWDLGTLYYRLSLPAHAAIARDLITRWLPDGGQIRTDAHPLVEMSLMRQNGRTLLHLVNLAGHSQTGYFPAPEMRAINISLAGRFRGAKALRSGLDLTLTASNGRTSLLLPSLKDYELLVLD
jgi:hypothetical protein